MKFAHWKPLILGLFLTFTGSVHAFDPTLGGPSGPAFQDPSIKRLCGSSVRIFAMRGSLQPNLANLTQPQLVFTSEAQHDEQTRSAFHFTLSPIPALTRYLKTHRVVTVVFTETPTGPIIKDTQSELKLCLIDGKSITDWEAAKDVRN